MYWVYYWEGGELTKAGSRQLAFALKQVPDGLWAAIRQPSGDLFPPNLKPAMLLAIAAVDAGWAG